MKLRDWLYRIEQRRLRWADYQLELPNALKRVRLRLKWYREWHIYYQQHIIWLNDQLEAEQGKETEMKAAVDAELRRLHF